MANAFVADLLPVNDKIAGAAKDVRFWHITDIDADDEHVRFWGKADIPDTPHQYPLMTHIRRKSNGRLVLAAR